MKDQYEAGKEKGRPGLEGGRVAAAEVLSEEDMALLPDTVRRLAELLGLEAALRLVRAMGGRTLRVPHGNNAKGRAVLAALARCVGEEGARILAREYAATQLYIPRCARVLAALRNAALARDHRNWSGQGCSERKLVSRLSERYGISDRYVWHLLRTVPARAERGEAPVWGGER